MNVLIGVVLPPIDVWFLNAMLPLPSGNEPQVTGVVVPKRSWGTIMWKLWGALLADLMVTLLEVSIPPDAQTATSVLNVHVFCFPQSIWQVVRNAVGVVAVAMPARSVY